MFLVQPQSTKSIFIQATITEFEPFYFLESLTTMAMGRERVAMRGGGVGLN
jgi:hypothetical protein